MKTIHFVSGMPRSGSTLLCNILAQNPILRCTHTSGCLDVLFGLRNQWDSLVEHRSHPDDPAKIRVLRSVLESYHSTPDGTIVLDKGRGWLAHLEMTEQILGRKAKVIVPVRRLEEIIASMEKLHRATAAIQQPPGEAQNYMQFQTMEGRCNYWASGEGVVGLAFNRIKDAVNRGFGDRMHFVDYDALCSHPGDVLRSIYNFLGEEPFSHDLTKVEQVTTENDDIHGYVNLHRIRPLVMPQPSYAGDILGVDLRAKYRQVQTPW